MEFLSWLRDYQNISGFRLKGRIHSLLMCGDTFRINGNSSKNYRSGGKSIHFSNYNCKYIIKKL